jgi:hypothetical protein
MTTLFPFKPHSYHGCPLLAQSRHAQCADECPLLGARRTLTNRCLQISGGTVGLPILFEGDLSPAERRHLHYGEIGQKNGVLVTSGMSGYTLVGTGTGETIVAARDAANTLADRVVVPNARYRRDIDARSSTMNFARWKHWVCSTLTPAAIG